MRQQFHQICLLCCWLACFGTGVAAFSSLHPSTFSSPSSVTFDRCQIIPKLKSCDALEGLRPSKRSRFQQDVLSKFTTTTTSSSSKNAGGKPCRRNNYSLLAAKSNGDDEAETEAQTSSSSKKDVSNSTDPETNTDAWSLQFQQAWNRYVMDRLPPLIRIWLVKIGNKLSEFFPTLKVALLSFATGSVLTLAAILVPVYSSVENLSEPVTLFETILADLELGYVDPINTNQLFETGMSAMLESLDPYTEFETKDAAQSLTEGIMGKYGGVGLVIAGTSKKDLPPPTTSTADPTTGNPQEAEGEGDEAAAAKNGVVLESDEVDDEDAPNWGGYSSSRRAYEKAKQKGIRVVSAFEGYAFDYGMRVGDKLTAVDDMSISSETTVDDVRNALRGDPGTLVTVSFERQGVKGEQSVTMPRRQVQLRDVKLATFLGKPSDGIGYISLSGFASSAGQEVRQAILALEQAAADASNGEHALKGLVLDLRGNPGGLLTSAVDVASLLVPKGSDIVSAKGRGFPGVTYRSRADPILDPSTKLAVLVNKGTASAAEIVSGAVQDLDVGVIIGADRTFGKGLVQNVEDLPFNTALKFTVAKYYTPSGRCIQGINYKEGTSSAQGGNGKFTASKIKEKDRQTFFTRNGRIVKDGGGIEADYKVEAPKASALEVTLLRSDILGEFASKWSAKNEFGSDFRVDDRLYDEFQDFVEAKQKSGDLKLDGIYLGAINDLNRALKESGYKDSERALKQLQTGIIREMKRDFETYKTDIKEDISMSILARYLPESMILERGLKTDKQVEVAAQLLSKADSFEKVLAKGSTNESNAARAPTLNMAASAPVNKEGDGASLRLKW